MGLSPDRVPPGCDDLSQLFTAGVAPSGAVHLFLAEELHDAGSQGLGLAVHRRLRLRHRGDCLLSEQAWNSLASAFFVQCHPEVAVGHP